MEQTAQIGPDQQIGPGVFNVGNLVVGHTRRYVRKFDGEEPPKAATCFRLGNAGQIEAVDRGKQNAGFARAFHFSQ